MHKETSLLTVMGLCLKELRMKREITQSEMAKHIGMTNAGWGRLENGKASLSVENMVLACHFLDTTPENLFIEINEVTEKLKLQGWEVHIKRVEQDGLIAGRELESSYEKIKAIPVVGGLTCAIAAVAVTGPVGSIVGASVAVAEKMKKNKEKKRLIKGDLVNKAASAYEWGESLKSDPNKNPQAQ